MTATYSANLRLVEQGTGDDIGTWGTVLNTGMIDQIDFAVAGLTTINTTGGTTTLSVANGAADQSRSAILIVTGALTSSATIVAPSLSKIYFISNRTTGAFSVNINTSGGTPFSIPQGESLIVFGDGTNFTASSASGSLSGIAVGNINMNDFIFSNASMLSYQEVLYNGGSVSGAITANFNNGNCQKFTLTGNTTLALSNFPSSVYTGSMTIKFIQDATGGRLLTIPGNFKVPGGGGITLSTAANAVDIMVIYTDDGGTTYNVNLLKGYA